MNDDRLVTYLSMLQDAGTTNDIFGKRSRVQGYGFIEVDVECLYKDLYI